MKKGLLLLCALALLVLSCAHAETEFVIPCGGQPALTLRYDENVYTLDRESYLSGSFGAHTWLGMFYDGHSTVELATDLYRDLPADPSPEALSAYLCAQLADAGCEPLEIYTTPARLAFVLLSLNRPTGPSYYAAIRFQDYVVYFELYNLRGGVTEVELNTLKTLLDCAALPLSY